MKLAIAAAALLLLVGFFLVKVLFGPRVTPLLLVGVLDYAAPLPPNAWTAEDFARFRATFLTDEGPGRAENIRVYSGPDEQNWRSSEDALLDFRQQLAKLEPGGPDKKTVLIYLSGHGILDAEGRPCLVLATDRGNANTWQPQLSRLADLPTLNLQDVVKAIEEGFDDADVKKVVLLDCNRIEVNPRLGILKNGFGDALKNLQFEDENLFLLSSADGGQLGWTLPDRQASAFGYYVCKGLAGRADDAQHAGNADDIVTLGELVWYLRKQVTEQVQARYLVDQTPVLLPEKSAERAAATPLAWSNADVAEETAAGEQTDPPVPWTEIDKLWSRHEELKEQSAASLAESTEKWRIEYKLDAERPALYRGADLLSFEAFQQGLLRLEQLNDAGSHYLDEAQRLAAGLKSLAGDLQGDEAELPAALALRGVEVPSGVQTQVEQFINRPLAEPDKEKLAALKQTTEYDLRAKAAWHRWSEWSRSFARPSNAMDDLQRTLDVLAPTAGGSPSAAGNCDAVEIRFLRLLSPGQFVPRALFAGQAMPLRSAILSRDLAETAAWANDDVRVHYAVEWLVKRGDAARRRAEDQLFIDPTALAANGRPWSGAEAMNAKEFYREALALAVDVSTAMDVRDQVWQEGPYLAQWLVQRHATDTERSAVVARLATCRELFALNKQLAGAIDGLMEKCLAAGERSDDETAERFATELKEARQKVVEAATAVRNHLSDLSKTHRDAISDAREAGVADVANLRRISDLLSTPLLTGDERGELRQLLLSSRLNVQALVARAARTTSGRAATAANRAQAQDHPLLALIGGDSDMPSDSGRLPGALRAALYSSFNNLRSAPAADESAAIARTDRGKLTAKAQQARAMAALWTLNPAYGEPEKHLRNPLAAVEAFDRHHAILWQASRALDDFWGREGDPKRSLYFDDLTELALREAANLGPGERGAAYNTIAATLNDRKLAAGHWLDFNVPAVQLPTTADRLQTVDTRPSIAVAPKIPVGRATLLAEPTGQQARPMRLADNDPWRERLAIGLRPAAGETAMAALAQPIDRITFQLTDAVTAASSQTWRLNMFYRGHVYPTQVVLTPKIPGQQFVLTRAKPEPPLIKVNGERRDPGAVTFIFDCSGSMGEPAVGGTRMDVAKEAFRATLEELADAGNYRVSVWFFGHRLIYDTNSKRVVTVCQKMPRINFPPHWCKPETMLLSDDVAPEWPDPRRQNRGPAVLTPRNLPEILGILDVVQPAGTTPLYLSIVRAIEDDPNLKSDQSLRRLVVLTDGNNEVWEVETKRRNIEAAGVVTAINSSSPVKGRQIQLHVIGFGAANSGVWTKNILPAIGQGDNYHDGEVNKAGLEEVIRKTLGLKQYDVVSDRKQIARQKVNREVVLKEHRDRQDYAVRIVGSNRPHRLTLEGGEAIDLFVAGSNDPNPRLEHARYGPDDFRANEQKHALANIATPAEGAPAASAGQKFYIGFHQPKREGGLVEFPISIQNFDETQFSRRPAEAWIEITPLIEGAADKPKPLVFYDMDFSNGRPVPVLLCRTRWPSEARRARINLFFKPQQTDTKLRQRIGAVEGAKPADALSVAVPNDRKAQFAVSVGNLSGQQGAQVTVTELCEQEADLHQAKVEIEPPADQVRREYFHSGEQQEVRHQFIYFDKTADDLRRDNWVRVTSRQALEDGAAKLDEAVEVNVDR